MPDADEAAAAKQALRRRLLAARRSRPGSDVAAARSAIAGHLSARLQQCAVVCAYLPLPTEPLEPTLLDGLVEAGVRVLVPIVAPDAPLDWTDHPTPTVQGPFGTAEPVGPRAGPDAIIGAEVVLVPALAVDRVGSRLGRGGGHYDRSLALLAGERSPAGGPGPVLIAVLFDGELLPEVPFDRHDIRVDAVVTPSGGLLTLTDGWRGPAG
jgi:5-formyltetrahydrofolate cyclo-ligase